MATSHGLSSAVAANIPVATYGVVLIVVMLLFPAGIQGAVRRLLGPAAPSAGGPISSLRRRAPAIDNPEEGAS